MPTPERRQPGTEPPESPAPRWQRWILPVSIAVLILVLVGPALFGGTTRDSISYTELHDAVQAGEVESIHIADDGAVTGQLTDGTSFSSQVPTALENSDLEALLRAKNVDVSASGGGASLGSILFSLLPLVVIVGLFIWVGRRAGRSFAASGLGGFGRAKAEINTATRPTTRFADVAGYEGVKQEVGEIVDFLRNPQRYAAAGAKGPGGVIMVGPPGTGKTLLARAVAGEAEVPFISVTGSAFVEMFVGVGASRVRDLFKEAREHAPSIIFIDEIDAIGGRRGNVGLGGHEEREQTLNQLLAEMDGFDQTSRIVVLAATNRPETLDPALLRPGRFDRHVTVPLPNQFERRAILDVHARSKKLDGEIDLNRIARATPGFSGADLANLLNEAAINAVRSGRTVLSGADVDDARTRILLGRREASNALLPEERHAVAVHESGHALLAALCPHADPVDRVTILPAGMALGATEQLPEAERHLYGQSYLDDLLAVRLGGRAAELVVFGEGSTGAANDLTGATQIATRMVREFGLSATLGPVGYSATAPGHLDGSADELRSRPYSEWTQRVVDEEVAALLRHAEERAVALLTEHREALDRLTATLMEEETVDGSAVLAALATKPITESWSPT